MKLFYKFSLDVFSSTYISGWAYNRFTPGKRLHLIFKDGTSVIGKCETDLLREDVKKATGHPTGYCGFSFALPTGFQLEQVKTTLTVSVESTGTLLCELHPGEAGKPLEKGKKKTLRQLLCKSSPAWESQARVFFMHIPKTAGTSFNSFAGGLYRPGEIITHIEAYDKSAYHEITEKYRFISGHLRMDSIERYFQGKNLQFYTLIREPYAHLHSHLNWLRGIGATPGSSFYQAHHVLFKELASSWGHRTRISNHELQRLVDNLDGVLKKLVDNGQSRYFLSEDPEQVEEKHFFVAEKNLQLFSLIGTTSGYRLFQEEFCKKHKFPVPPTEKPLNRSKYESLYDHTDPTSREIVRPLVQYDLRLYNLVAGEKE